MWGEMRNRLFAFIFNSWGWSWGRTVAYNFSTDLSKCYLAGVKLCRRWECLQGGSRCCPALLCWGTAAWWAAKQAPSHETSHISHMLMSGDKAPPGIRGHLVFLCQRSTKKMVWAASTRSASAYHELDLLWPSDSSSVSLQAPSGW